MILSRWLYISCHSRLNKGMFLLLHVYFNLVSLFSFCIWKSATFMWPPSANTCKSYVVTMTTFKWPHSDQGEDKLPITWQCLIQKMILTGLISEYCVNMLSVFEYIFHSSFFFFWPGLIFSVQRSQWAFPCMPSFVLFVSLFCTLVLITCWVQVGAEGRRREWLEFIMVKWLQTLEAKRLF